jgi:hypothetical protein
VAEQAAPPHPFTPPPPLRAIMSSPAPKRPVVQLKKAKAALPKVVVPRVVPLIPCPLPSFLPPTVTFVNIDCDGELDYHFYYILDASSMPLEELQDFLTIVKSLIAYDLAHETELALLAVRICKSGCKNEKASTHVKYPILLEVKQLGTWKEARVLDQADADQGRNTLLFTLPVHF